MLQVLIVLLLYPVLVILRILLTLVFLFVQLIFGAITEVGGEAAEKVLDSFFEDKVRGKRFPLLAGLVSGLLVGGAVFLFFVFGGDPGELLDPWVIRLGVGLPFALMVGAFAGFLVWDAATEYQKRKRYKQESERRAQEINKARREERAMWE